MRLVLLDYLRTLRERAELEGLVANLLRAMRWTVISSPEVGARQNGVDFAAVGIDPGDRKRHLFLFVLKAGDIDRTAWQSGVQAVRPSIEQILDTYLPECVPAEHRHLPERIVLVTGGALKQQVKQDWAGFTQKHSTDTRTFAFWGGDSLAEHIERYLLNERLFPEDCRNAFRKLLALAGETVGTSPHFGQLVQALLPAGRPLAAGIRGVRTLNLSLRILLGWCEEADNLDQPWLCAERALLTCWEWGRAAHVMDDSGFQSEFSRLFATYLLICGRYVNKLAPYCVVRDGLSRTPGLSPLEYHLWVYEVLGRIAMLGLSLSQAPPAGEDDKSAGPLQKVARLAACAIENHPMTHSPALDDHVIEVALVLNLLLVAGPEVREYGGKWLENMVGKIRVAYKYIGRHYPVDTSSFDDLLDMLYGDPAKKSEHTRASTLMPVLAEFCLLYGREEAYQALVEMVRTEFPHACLQMWFPDETTDAKLYVGNAGQGTGTSYTNMRLPDKLTELSNHVAEAAAHVWNADQLSCIQHGMGILAWISARHFRTPPVPQFWQRHIAPSDDDGGTPDSVEQAV